MKPDTLLSSLTTECDRMIGNKSESSLGLGFPAWFLFLELGLAEGSVSS